MADINPEISHHCHILNSRRKIFQTEFMGTFMIHRHAKPDKQA
jgi:hypothetical protein